MTLLPLLLLLASASLAAGEPAADPRQEAWDQFRSLYASGDYAGALPLAQRVIELTEAAADRDHELPTAWSNLGATQLQLGDHAAALASYRQALELLEATQGIASRRLIGPLAGLGSVHAAMQQHALAAEFLSRALAVSRRADGLFNLAQMPLIDQLVDSQLALGNLQLAERERIYALRVSEQNFGFDDPRTLPSVVRLARFYESLAQFAAARGLYLRMRDISMKEGGLQNPTTIRALLAIGRSHRLQYTLDPDSLIEAAAAEQDSFFGRPAPTPMATNPSALRPDRVGEQALDQALAALRGATDPPRELLVEALIEMGDWMTTLRRTDAALPYYAEAVALAATAADGPEAGPLAAPRQVFFRPPPASLRSRIRTPGTILARRAEFSLTVGEDGTPRDITVVSNEMGEGQRAQMQRALERALYSPRFEGGAPRATEGVRFNAVWYELEAPEQESAGRQ
jgi:tetratricopeptide (TPR) repeat protein